MVLKVEGEMNPNLASYGDSELHLSQHSADGKECFFPNICKAVTAVPDRDSIREEWFACACGFKGMVEQLSSKQWKSVSKLAHIALDQEAEGAAEVGGQGNLQRLSLNDLLPQPAKWFLKLSQPPQIATLAGNKHQKHEPGNVFQIQI